MKKSKRILFLLLAIGVGIFDQAFQIFNYGYLKKYLDRICSDQSFAGVVGSSIELIIFASIFYFVFYRRGSELRNFDRDYKRLKLKNYQIFLIALGLSGTTEVWLYIAENYLSFIPAIKNSLDLFNKAMNYNQGESSFILALIYGTVLAALMEEFLFRGIIHNSIKLSFRSRLLAILLTGIVFGIWHGILVQAIYAALGGIFFSYIYERTGKISVTIAIHFISNFISSIAPELDKILPGTENFYELVTLFSIPFLFYYLRDKKWFYKLKIKLITF